MGGGHGPHLFYFERGSVYLRALSFKVNAHAEPTGFPLVRS